MAQYVPLSPDRHASFAWKRYASYRFAASEAVQPIVNVELPRAAMFLPIAFVPADEGHFLPVVVLGPSPGVNVFVAPDGRWQVPYVPAALRSYPFKVALAPDGQKVVCVDEASGLIVDRNSPDAELFYGDDKALAPAVREVVGLLQSVEAAWPATLQVTQTLARHGLIQPWAVQLDVDGKGRTHTIAGLYRVDEEALNALPDDAFLELRRSGALPIAYSQLLSIQHIGTLQALAHAHAVALDARSKLERDGELDLGFLKSDTIRF